MGAVAGDRVEYETLEHVAKWARPYPVAELAGCETGLVLFAAAFLGHNDAVHYAEAGIRTTCVDLDAERLEQMRALYPDAWTFVDMDAFVYARGCQMLDQTFDVVSLDPFSGDAMARVWEELELWTSIASRRVIVGYAGDVRSVAEPPEGWRVVAALLRAAGVYWITIGRA